MTIQPLPPLGTIGDDPSKHAGATSYLSYLAEEASDGRAAWIDVADRNVEIYTYGAALDEYDPAKILVNEIQSAIIAAVDIQTKQPPVANLAPVETGEPAQTYWAGPLEAALQLGVPPECLVPMDDPANPGATVPPQPIDEITAERLKTIRDTGYFPEDWMVDVDDKTVSDTFQTVHDVYYARSGGARFLRQNLLANSIKGCQFALLEFDNERQRFMFKNLYLRQVYIDPICEDIADAAYAGVDLVIDANEAKSLWPELSDAIEKESSDGQPQRPDSSTSLGSMLERNFRRNMVTLRVFWIRNEPAPLSPEDALAGGHVEPFVNLGETAEDATQAGYLKPGTDTQVDPAHAEWPTRRVLRQITQLVSTIVDDKECEHADIPLLHNVNIPVPGQPWGIGEPMRLTGLQRARSRMLNAITEHAEYFKSPIVTVSQSVYADLPDSVKDTGVKPGLMLVVPNDQWMATGGKILSIQDPPQTPPGLIEGQSILHQEISEQSGHSDAMRGVSEGSGDSGKKIELLQQAGSSQVSFKAQRTADMIEQQTRLMLHIYVHVLTCEQIGQVVSKYKPHILEAICERGKRAEWDVKVEIAAGTGAMVAQRKQEAITLLNTVDPSTGETVIGMETAREMLSIDNQQEISRRKAALAAAQAAMPLQPAAPGEGEDEQNPQSGQTPGTHPTGAPPAPAT